MTFEDADKLVDDFVEKYKIQDAGVDFHAFSINELPYSTGTLKYAHFIVAEYFIMRGSLDKALGDLLIKSYGYIAHFIDEEKTVINDGNKENSIFENKIHNGEFYSSPLLDNLNNRVLSYTIEFNNFLAECQRRNSPPKNV